MHILQWLLQTKGVGTNYNEKKTGELPTFAYIYSNHTTCFDSRRSVLGEATLVSGQSVAWCPRTQQVNQLWTSESGCVALVELVKEYLRRHQTQQPVVLDTKERTVTIKKDNQGASNKKQKNKTSRQLKNEAQKYQTQSHERDNRQDNIIKWALSTPSRRDSMRTTWPATGCNKISEACYRIYESLMIGFFFLKVRTTIPAVTNTHWEQPCTNTYGSHKFCYVETYQRH